MKERPILFSGPMVQAILDGRKTQTRRVIKVPEWFESHLIHASDARGRRYDVLSNIDGEYQRSCPYGMPGDRLWVRETWQSFGDSSSITPPVPHSCQVRYDSDGGSAWLPVPDGAKGVFLASLKKRPAIHMPRWASRITLEVTEVRVERLKEISEEDAQNEGAGILMPKHEYLDGNPDRYRKLFKILWESINGPGSWDANPWVWVVEFKRIKP